MRGVRLVAIDTPSVDRGDSKDLPTHAQFFAHDISIIEGADASPVRAILRK
jgi:kynurenine formamidase